MPRTSLSIQMAPVSRRAARIGFEVHSVGRIVVVTDRNMKFLAVALDLSVLGEEVGFIVSTARER
jgi:hypothetical protein